MKNAYLFLLVAGIQLYGCALSVPQSSAMQRDRDFQDFSMARAQALNDWWGSR